MDTPLEESNLAHIGSDEDKAAREAAAKLEVNWEGCGQEVGIEIWRVENKRDENDNPDFGINVWPKKQYGQFHQGDSYIVLKTSKAPEEEGLEFDIYFWIGSKSSQDEYGVAAYKANELDDLLGDEPIQHREVQGLESSEFSACFPGGVHYLEGGIESGFREVGADSEKGVEMPTSLFLVHRGKGRKSPIRSYGRPVSSSSLNEGDAFVLDAIDTVYTWYGSECSPFEKRRALEVANSMVEARAGHSKLEADITGGSHNDDVVDAFWTALGGKGDIASAATSEEIAKEGAAKPTKMAILNDEDSHLVLTKIDPPSKEKLDTGVVVMLDVGSEIVIWIGKEATKREQAQAMTMVGTYLKILQRQNNTRVLRIREGQERRCAGWDKIFG